MSKTGEETGGTVSVGVGVSVFGSGVAGAIGSELGEFGGLGIFGDSEETGFVGGCSDVGCTGKVFTGGCSVGGTTGCCGSVVAYV